MSRFLRSLGGRGLTLVLASGVMSAPAWAAYVETMVISGEDAEEVPSQTITFIPTGGTPIAVETAEDDEDDDRVILYLTLPDDVPTEGVLRIGEGETAIDIGLPSVAKGEDIAIDLDTRTARIVPESAIGAPVDSFTPDYSKPAFGFSFGGTALGVDAPPIGVGLERTSDTELFALQTDDSADGVGYYASVDYVSPTLGGFLLTAEYFEDDDEQQGSVPQDTNDTGNVYLDYHPNDGSTGILYGPSGLDVESRSTFSYWSIGGTYALPQNFGLPHGLQIAPSFEFSRLELDVSTYASPTAYGSSIVDMRWYEIEGNYLDLGVTVFRPFYLDPNFKLMPHATIGAQHWQMALDAEEDFFCGICGPGTSFNLTIDDEDEGFTWRGGIGLSAFYNLGSPTKSWDGVTLFADASADWTGEAPTVFIPRSGNDLFLDNHAAGVEDGGDYNRQRLRFGVRFQY